MNEIEQFIVNLNEVERQRLVDHCTSVLGLEGGFHDPSSSDPIMALPSAVYRWLDSYLAERPATTLRDILALRQA